jgi:hypothetical protein
MAAWGDNEAMSLLKYFKPVFLGLLAAVSVMAGEADQPTPLTLEQVDRAQDLYLDSIQQRIVAASEKPTKAGLSDLWHHISHAKSSDRSPFAPGFQHYHVAASSIVAKSARPKSSTERQAQQDIDEIFSKTLKFVVEATEAFESNRTRVVTYRLKAASKEVTKVGAVLDAQRKRRASQAVANKGQQSVAGATKPQNGAAPVRK